MEPLPESRESILSASLETGTISFGKLAKILQRYASASPEFDQLLSALERSGIQVLPEDPVSYDAECQRALSTLQFEPAAVDDALLDFDDPLGVYGREVSKVPFLSADRELELVTRMAVSPEDEPARKELVEAHLRQVIDIAARYRRPEGVHILEIIQHGNVGLMKASSQFTAGGGYGFTTYAAVCVHEAIHDFIHSGHVS